MSLQNSFDEDVRTATNNLKMVSKLLEERKEDAASGRSTAKIDAQILSYMHSAKSSMRTLEDGLKKMSGEEASVEKMNANNDVLSKLKAFQEGVQKAVTKVLSYKQRDLMASDIKEKQKAEDGEYEETRQLNNKLLNENVYEKIAVQDEMLKGLLGYVEASIETQKNIKTELKQQKGIMNDISEKTDNNIQDLVVLDNKVKRIIAMSSNCCLWIWIVLMIAIWVVLLIFFH